MLRSAWIVLVATLALIGPAECSENRAATSRNEGKAHVAAFRPPAEVIVDDNGNLTDDGTRLLHYDYKNRLVAVSDKASMRPVAAYEYLPDGRRAKKTVFAVDGSVAKATAFFYDGAQEVEEQDAGSGAIEATYVWSPVYVDELVTYTNAQGTFYTHQDARCDVVAITDAAGAVVERVRFDDFGRAEIRGPGGEVRAASAVGCAYGFQGRRLDAETGLLYFRARMYDPETGRFVQRDPVWDAGNVGGQYTFVGNGPLSGRDPSGLMEGLSPREVKALKEAKAAQDALNAARASGGALEGHAAQQGARTVAQHAVRTGTSPSTLSRAGSWGPRLTPLGNVVARAGVVGFGAQKIHQTWEARQSAEGAWAGAREQLYLETGAYNALQKLRATQLTQGKQAVFEQFFTRELGRAATATDVQVFAEALAQGQSEFEAAQTAARRGKRACEEEGGADRDNLVTIYRGVHNRHPDLPNAKRGMAVPRGGPATPAEHNAGDTRSDYTAWTYRESTADYMADRYGPGGVKLTKTVPLDQLVPSPDRHNEAEVFLRGTVTGAHVTNMTGQNGPRRKP